MTKQLSDSSQPEKQRRENESRIVRQTLDADFQTSAESLERLRRLEELPDSEIRTDLIPELPPEAWKSARKNPYVKLLHGQVRRKAS